MLEPLLDTMGLRRCQLYVFWGGHKTWGDSTCGIHFPVLLGIVFSRLFYVLECLYEFVFEPGGGVFVENFVGVGVL